MNMRGLMISVTDSVTGTCFLHACCDKLGAGFHPDTNFNDYIVYKTGKRTFTKLNAKFLNTQMKKVLELIEDPYKVCLDYMEVKK